MFRYLWIISIQLAVFSESEFDNMLSRFYGVTVDGIWIGNCMYYILTDRNYK
jgi:hypothetical protein